MPEELCDYLDLMNLSTLLGDSLDDDDLLPGAVQFMLGDSVAFEKAFAKRLLEELEQLGTKFEQVGVRPILLKGPALWGDAYPIYHERKVCDIDLIAETPTEALQICRVLGANGYQHAGVVSGISMNDGTQYELPMFPKPILMECERDVGASVDRFIRRGAVAGNVRKLEVGQYEIMMDADVHTAIWAGRHPELRGTDFSPWGIQAPYRVMTRATTLPYLCTKLWIDVCLGTRKCLKLLADIVRVLERASQREVVESIRTAERWNVMTSYLQALGWVVPLAPELELAGVVPGPVDAVSRIVDCAIERMTSASMPG